MSDFSIPVDDVDKYQNFIGYFLIDIKIVFILTYVYITVVNVISTTANNEANQDVENPVLLNVTALPEHTNVIVNYIDDSVLWSCRKESPTKDYYFNLYWMLLSVFIVTLAFYAASKSFALFNITTSDSLSDLWHMGVIKHLKKRIQMKNDCSPADATRLADCYGDLLDNKIPEKVYKKLAAIKERKILPHLSLWLLVFGLIFSALSYDLHPLSCISGIPEESISYNNMTQTVELRYLNWVLSFQQPIVFIACLLFFFLVITAFRFKKVISNVIIRIQDEIEDEINTAEERKIKNEIKEKEAILKAIAVTNAIKEKEKNVKKRVKNEIKNQEITEKVNKIIMAKTNDGTAETNDETFV